MTNEDYKKVENIIISDRIIISFIIYNIYIYIYEQKDSAIHKYIVYGS